MPFVLLLFTAVTLRLRALLRLVLTKLEFINRPAGSISAEQVHWHTVKGILEGGRSNHDIKAERCDLALLGAYSCNKS